VYGWIEHDGGNAASRYGLAVHGNLTKKDGSFIVYCEPENKTRGG
jgi:hypothetical protein